MAKQPKPSDIQSESSPPAKTAELEEGSPSQFTRLFEPAKAFLNHAQEAGRVVAKTSKDLASKTTEGVTKVTGEVGKAAEDVDPLAVAGGVAAMSAGEVVGMTLGGAIGAVAGPGGAIMGAQLGAFAGSSLGARYGYDLVSAQQNEGPNPDWVDPCQVLTQRGVERLGGAVGEAGGVALGAALGGARTQGVFAHLGDGIGGSIGEQSVGDTQATGNPSTSDQPYRKAPTQAWFKRIAKENIAETVVSGALGAVGGLVGGAVGQKLAERAGIVAARRLNFADASEPEFVQPPLPEAESPPAAGAGKDHSTQAEKS